MENQNNSGAVRRINKSVLNNSNQNIGKLPPQAVDLEAVLGAMMRNYRCK